MYALAYDKLPGRSVYHAPESHTEMQLAQSCNVRRFRQREECFEIGADLLDSSGNPTRPRGIPKINVGSGYHGAMGNLNGHLRILPLTPDLWQAFEDLLQQGGPCSRCWCMYWRIGAGYRKQTPLANKSTFHVLVEKGPPPGLIALLKDQAVAWCQLTPAMLCRGSIE